MTNVPDARLLEQFARSGSEQAFAALVQRHIALVHSVALRNTANPQHAEDITQAVFVLLARKAGALGRNTVLPGWLYQTARLTSANLQRAEMRRIRREQEAFMQSQIEESPTDTLWRELSPQLDEAMAGLGTTERDALVLRYFQNKSMAEVGEYLGLEENTAQKRVGRALEKLRNFFTKRGVNSTTVGIADSISVHSVHAVPAALAKSISAVALTRGSAASASTLTLVKGALKIMAWTKAKAAIVTGVAFLIITGTATVAMKAVKSSRDNAIFEQIWAQPDSRSLNALIHAPPALIVRPTHYATKGGQGYWTDARIGHGIWVNASVSDLVGFAYHFPSYRTVFTDNMPGGQFDLMETLPAGRNEVELKKEIQKRFGLVGRTETRETDALRLMVNDPAKLNSHVSVGGQPGAYGTGGANNIMNYVFKNQTLVEVSHQLEGYFDQPVVEPNGLTGHYDFTLQVNYKLQREALQQSFRDQFTRFGLELVPGRAPVEMLVVEKAK